MSISLAGIYSLIKNFSWIRGCFALWYCCSCVFAFSFIRGWMSPSISSVSLSITTSFSYFSSLSQGFHLLTFQSVFLTSTWILIHSGLDSPSFAKKAPMLRFPIYYPVFASCLLTVVDTLMSVSNLGSSNIIPLVSASSWHQWLSGLFTVEGSSLCQPVIFLFFLLEYPMCSFSIKCCHTEAHKHLTHGPLLHRLRWMAIQRFPPKMPLSQDSFLQSPEWFNSCLKPCGVQVKLKTAPIRARRDEERSRSLQTDRWKV